MKTINIGMLAHVDAGKTTLTEQILYVSGAIREKGSVDKGNAHMDTMEVERCRGISVKAVSTQIKWKEVHINIIDTPGHLDFSGEVERSIRVLDCAVLIISAVEGVQAQTELICKALKEMKIPFIIFINKIDRIGADIDDVMRGIKEKLFIDPISFDNLEDQESIIEYLCDKDDLLMEEYLENGIETFDNSRILSLTEKAFKDCLIYPVISGSAINNEGTDKLLNLIESICPRVEGDSESELSAVIFKLEHNKTLGSMAHVKIYNGNIRNRDMVHNTTRSIDEKVIQIKKNIETKLIDAQSINTGEIGIVCGLTNSRVGDILGSPKFVPSDCKITVPLLKAKFYTVDDKDYPNLVEALQELTVEDPLLDMQWQKEEREILINVTGLIQLEILEDILKTRYNIDAKFDKPTIIYKETPTEEGIGYDSYTMPKPCWAVLKFQIKPGEKGSGIKYKSIVSHDKILLKYQSQVEQAIPNALKQGSLGWEVTDLEITLIDGEHHVMHTHPMDFMVATPMAIMNGLVNTGTTLLEPILKFKISAPEEFSGKIIGEIINMRGHFDSPIINKGIFTIEGVVPAATSMDFSITLASMTGGRAFISTSFHGYEKCPLELGATTPYRGVNPLDRSKYILYIRNAL